MLVTPPASCTKTKFSYVSSKQLNPDTGLPAPLTSIAGDPAQSAALLITTYVVTPSSDAAGQDIPTTYCDIFLKPGAIEGPDASTALDEASYLSQCADPSSFLCAESTSTLGACLSTTGPIVYPPTSFAGAGLTTTTAAGPTPTKHNGATGVSATRNMSILIGIFVCLSLSFV